jgi:beta-lactamase regulating signal transducer with metallopeptidase domain
MMTSELAPLVLRTALFTGLAILVLLAMRAPLRRWLGATLAYQAWLVVPVVAAASLLPDRSAPQLLSVQALRPVQALAARAAAAESPQQLDFLLFTWACGATAAALWFAYGHLGFLRQAGRLTRIGSVYVSGAGAGPASVGLFRPRIVVPHDFAQRYAPAEQALVIAHEQVHIGRRDALVNLMAAAFQCAFWFNPLVHIAARCLRQDQELACDAAVMQAHPGQRRTYAEALLKSHTGAVPAAGIHCHWQTQHPTKERIMSLQQNPPGTLRRLAGRCTLAVLAAGAFGATLGVRAEQPQPLPRYSVAMVIQETREPAVTLKLTADSFVEEPGKEALPRVLTAAGEKFSVSSGEWRLDMVVRPGDTPDTVWLAGKLFKGGALISAPTLLTQVGEAASIKIGDHDRHFSMAMTVTSQR